MLISFIDNGTYMTIRFLNYDNRIEDITYKFHVI